MPRSPETGRRRALTLIGLAALPMTTTATAKAPAATPHYRPAWHFTPRAHWMNDPNGLVFHQGTYHLFFQHHPHGDTWGPMHWGHATSTDLLRWQEQPIALKPDALGMIFSGSAVLDAGRRSGLGPEGSQPLVAVFTHHDPVADQAGRTDRQHQSLAYSVDGGRTWTTYAGNPVLRNPGAKDFRDPKVRWLPEQRRWTMALACGDHIRFYGSTDLRNWTEDSRFGAGIGAHGGVWECPDLLPLPGPDGRVHWLLLVSLTPGGPNGGSATQYFIGQFDGRRFTPHDERIRWLDFGPDDYAGVTWAEVDDRALFIGWMSNWQYADKVPTAPWRSAMTMPRELLLRPAADGLRVASVPAREVQTLGLPPSLQRSGAAVVADAPLLLSAGLAGANGRFMLSLSTAALRGFTLVLANAAGDALQIGFDAQAGQWWIDRSRSGDVGFHPAFAQRAVAPRLAAGAAADLQLWFDSTSVEAFADGGLSVLTVLFFPRAPWDRLALASSDGLVLENVTIRPLRDPR